MSESAGKASRATKRSASDTPPTPPPKPERPVYNAEVISAWQFGMATAGALLIGALYLVLPLDLLVGPRWLLLVLEVVLLAPLVIARAMGYHLSHRVARLLSYGLLAALTLQLVISLVKLVQNLPRLSPQVLLTSGVLLWGANILIFATWYWETDGDGPVSRHHRNHEPVDFRFTQQEDGAPHNWRPGFIDYLFLAFCTATALSPADTLPLTRRAKVLMMVEAIISMIVIVLLVARFVNIV